MMVTKLQAAGFDPEVGSRRSSMALISMCIYVNDGDPVPRCGLRFQDGQSCW